jgi:hypothetical protein
VHAWYSNLPALVLTNSLPERQVLTVFASVNNEHEVLVKQIINESVKCTSNPNCLL